MPKIAILGTGTVGQTLASRLIALGHEVWMGTRNVSEKLESTTQVNSGNPPFSDWLAANKGVHLGTFAEAAAYGDILLNATQGAATLSALNMAGEKNLAGKILVDIANPLDFSKGMPPTLIPALSNTNSLGEEIQKTFPATKVVKTLNTMWCGLMVNPVMISGGDHTNFICGNDPDAKEQVKMLLHEFGWKEPNILDLGDITASRGTELLLPVWLRVYGATKNGAFNFKIVS